MNLGDIKARVATLANRTNMTVEIATFVEEEILEIHSRLDLSFNGTRTVVTLDGTETTELDKTQLPYPTDFKAAKSIFFLVDSVRQYKIPWLPLSMFELVAAYSGASQNFSPPYIEVPLFDAPTVTTGQPLAVTADRGFLWFTPKIAASEIGNQIEITYRTVADFSSKAANYEPVLLALGWPVVLYGALARLSRFLKDDESATSWTIEHNRARKNLMSADVALEQLSVDTPVFV